VDENPWDEMVADPWIRFADVVDEHSRPFGEAAMDALEPLEGTSVLDVGCGTGQTTWALGSRVGPKGLVIGVDLSAPFVETARTRGDAPNVSFVAADAATVELDTVDRVFSRMGVMFFADPIGALSHLRSRTRPGGRLAFACWQDPLANPWMSVPVMASAEVLGPPDLPAPGSPGPFAFADPDRIHAVLTEAGWSDVVADDLTFRRPFPGGDAAGMADVVTQLSPPLAAGLREHPERRDELLATIAEALAPYERDGEVVLQAAAWIVSATN
jgi:SAM-dependent methyltransferase